MLNRKAKGSRRERQAKKMLEKEGYYCVKSGASLGVFDIIAILNPKFYKEDKVIHRAIQVKSNICESKEIERIKNFSLPAIWQKEVWIFKDRVREPIVRVIR